MSCPTSLKRAQENSDKLCMMPTPDGQSIHYLVNLYVIMTEESFKETFGQDKTGAFLLSFPFFFFFLMLPRGTSSMWALHWLQKC